MNCLEFRRAAASNPRKLDAATAAHAAQCAPCRDFLANALELERRIEKALRVRVPRELAKKLAARASSRRAAGWYAAAAAVLLAAGLAASAMLAPDDPLARAGIDFVVYEEARTIAEAKPVEAGIIARVARQMSVSLPPEIGDVRYICFYPLAEGSAHHFLVTTPLGKATLLFFPGEPRRSRASASAKGLKAAVMPLPGGTAAIVADSARSLARIETLLKPI
ncbi:MAG: DUF3379 family protein [Betaproteobacteria bacterium]